MLTMNGLPGALVIAPAVIAALACVFGSVAPRRYGQAGAIAAGLGFVSVLALAVSPDGGRAASVAIVGAEFSVDRLAAVLLLLIFGVSAIVQAFAVRYLAGDPRQAWFVAGAGLLTAASAGLAMAATLITLAVCWTLAGVALCVLLGTYWHLPAARDGVRRTATAFLIGDLALWAAVLAATATWGNVDLRAGGTVEGALAPVLGVLVVLAALSRSGQVPFHRWLPATLAAPTPVSALLHAGVVNAGGILIIRMAPLATHDLGRALTIGAGAATMAYGAAVMIVKPDVKGALAHSTTAQMGFMILTCGLGLWAAAVIHLVAHGFYKATLFLSSGSAVAAHRRGEAVPRAVAPGRRQLLANLGAAVAIPAAALATALAVVPDGSGSHASEQALLVFAWVTGGAVTWGWLRRRPGVGPALWAASFVVPAATAYVAIITAVGTFLDPALPASPLHPAAVWGATVIALIMLGALAAIRLAPGADRLRRALYTRALAAGHLPTPPSSALLTGAHS
jgi:NADH:ubiquinone oxidoreductase subunit 5 (subunit L)/multisubunit Na+/H+ antiporter MnhA subunit